MILFPGVDNSKRKDKENKNSDSNNKFKNNQKYLIRRGQWGVRKIPEINFWHTILRLVILDTTMPT